MFFFLSSCKIKKYHRKYFAVKTEPKYLKTTIHKSNTVQVMYSSPQTLKYNKLDA